MRCVMCDRPLRTSAIQGLCIGPVCAKKRGLWAGERRTPRIRLFDTRATDPTTHQIDWVNLINAGGFAGESAAK